MAGISDYIAFTCVVLAVALAIFSTPVMGELEKILPNNGNTLLLLIEVALFVVVVGTALYGQRMTRSRG